MAWIDDYIRINLHILGLMEDLVGKTEDWMSGDWKKLEEKFDDAIEQEITDKQLFRLGQEKNIEQSKLGHVYPRILRNSILVYIFGYFEKQISVLCTTYQNSNETISLKDLRGSVINRIRIYLIKIMKIEIPSQLSGQGSLQLINKIRNTVIHNDGIAIDEGLRTKIRKLAEKTIPFITIDSNGRLDIFPEFLFWVIKEMKSCMEELSTQIKDNKIRLE